MNNQLSQIDVQSIVGTIEMPLAIEASHKGNFFTGDCGITAMCSHFGCGG